jgi:uncharacterized membrane protein YebE (DUF533 family)
VSFFNIFVFLRNPFNMFNARQILDRLVGTVQGASSQSNTGLGGILNNPMVAGAGGGLLAGLLLGNKKVRKMGGTVAKVGGAAVLGTIAYKAYSNWQTNKNRQASAVPAQYVQQPQAVLDFDNLPPAKQEEQSRAMLAAMVAAAKADGHFDERERQIIHEQLRKIGDAETTAWVQQEIYKPLDVNSVASLATSPELAAEIYLASLIVIDEQNEREKIYLNSLAEKLKLEPQLRLEIERQIDNS